MNWIRLKGSGRVVLSLALGLVGGSSGATAPEGAQQPSCLISGQQCTSQKTLTSDYACRLTQLPPTSTESPNPSCYQGKKGTGTTECGTWGPHVYDYPVPQLAAGTSCPLTDPAWLRLRVMAFADRIVQEQYNYCHHHVPTWLPPNTATYRNSKGASLTCTPNRHKDGRQAASSKTPFPDKEIKWQGFDCSDFTTYLYDMALGVNHAQLSSGIAQQACQQGANDSTGVLLDINTNNFDATSKHLLPGDLLYIMGGAPSGDTKISHVVVWTGQTYAQIARRPDAQTVLGADFKVYAGGTTPPDDTPMIVDSHYAGAAYRPFLGWYRQSLSHVRRIIGHFPGSTPEPLPQGLVKQVICTGTGDCTTQHPCAPVFTQGCARPTDFLVNPACK